MVFDLTTLCVWALRIVVPILFFAIYFRFQAPAKQSKNAGPTTNVHSRGKLLLLRAATKDCAAPEVMKNIALKDQSTAPHLFAGNGRGARVDRSSRRAPDENRAPKAEKREKREKKEPEPTSAASALSDEKMHMESLLNYVAFNRNEQQRVFLPMDSEEGSPSPPSQQKKAVGESKLDGNKSADRAVSSSVTSAAAQKANDEAQMVLQGAVSLQRQDVARALYEQLIQANVEIAESTYELMIDVSIAAQDLKAASDFLMKLEDAGFAPGNAILDKVLDLYSTQQNEPQQEKLAKADSSPEAPLDLLLDDLSGALSSAAATSDQVGDEAVEIAAHEAQVVPTEYVMPPASFMPTFNWDAIESDSDGDDSEDEAPKVKLSSDAPEFVPGFMPGPTSQTAHQDVSQSTMFPTAFEGMYPWGGQSWSTDRPDTDSAYDDRSKGKAKGKGKGKWKSSKGEWDDGWHGKSGGSTEWDDGWQGKSGGGKGEWKDGWHRSTGGGDAEWNGEWPTKNGGDQGSQAEEPRNEVEKKAHSKEAKNWKKTQMTWRPKGES